MPPTYTGRRPIRSDRAPKKGRVRHSNAQPTSTGNSVSLVARHRGIAGNQLFTWRRLMAQGALTAAGAGEQVVPASELRAAHQQIRELQRLLGKKTLENEILREAVERVTAPKKLPSRVTSWPGDGR